MKPLKRIVNQQLQDDFDQHWQVNSLSQISDSKLYQAEIFFRPVIPLLRTQPLKILDVGCGDGVHWHYLRHLGNEQLYYTGIDISTLAIKSLRQQSRTDKDRFIQMDAVALDEPDNHYDVVFAFGVVAYTSDPQRCFSELCRVCKPGGWIGVWIYPQQEGLPGLAFNLTRQICQRVGPFWTRRIADLIVPLLGILPTQSRVNLQNATWRQCREVVLVNIAPKQLVFYRRDEIANWFAIHAIRIEYEDPGNPITIWGQK